MSTASRRAYEIIKTGIVDGRFAPGQRLKESELTELCAVSRTPVREALRQLANEGMALLSPNHGAQVVAMGEAELADLYELRCLVESQAAARAAERISADQLAALTRLADQMEAAASANPGAAGDIAPANSDFHEIVLEAAGSGRLTAMARLVIEAPLSLRTLERYAPDELDRSMRHHRELIAAFAARDADWARAVMTSHIRAAYTVVRDTRQKASSDD